MTRYIRLFLLFARQSFSSDVANVLDFWTYVVGKFIRVGFFLAVLFSIFRLTPTLGGYNFPQVLLIFATYNCIDLATQLLFVRGMHRLQDLVRRGRFDAVLTYPISPLFYSAFRIIDYMDLVTLVPMFFIIGWALKHLAITFTVAYVITYLLLVLNGIFIVFSVNVAIASFTFWTYELEHTWWLYRFTLQAARYPIEIFRQPFRFVLTWVLPLGLIVTFPVKALLGILTWQFAVGAFLFAGIFFFCALSFWRYALTHYSSASS